MTHSRVARSFLSLTALLAIAFGLILDPRTAEAQKTEMPTVRTVALTSGLPPFPPLTRRFERGWHSELWPGVTFVWGEKAETDERRFWIMQRSEEGTSLREVPMVRDGKSLAGEVVMELEGSRSRIRLRVEPASRSLSYEAAAERDPRLRKGDHFPLETLKQLEGSLPIADIKGKWVVVNWWATSCVPCKEEIPLLNQLVESAPQNTVFLAITVEDRDLVRRFLKKFPFHYRQTIGSSAISPLMGEEYPRHLIINPEGVIVTELTGALVNIDERLKGELERARNR